MSKKHPHAGLTGHTRDFVKLVSDLAHGGRDVTEILDTYLEMAYCTLAKRAEWLLAEMGLQTRERIEAAEALEARYMAEVRRCKDDKIIQAVPRLHYLTSQGVIEEGDFLGKAVGELGALNSHLGQFFTPFSIGQLMSALLLGPNHHRGRIEKDGFTTLHEPAVGAGGMILAAVAEIERQGFDVGITIMVQAADISPRAFKMAYVQLALRGVPALLYLGDTLALQFSEERYTPAFAGFIAKHGHRMQSIAAAMDAEEAGEADVSPAPTVESPSDEPPKEGIPVHQLTFF
jgi:hypothetical protein